LEYFKGKKVLVTGHSGFKGSWLVSWLDVLGAEVVGLALDPPTTPSHFSVSGIDSRIEGHRMDIREKDKVVELICRTEPDVVFHLAAQSLVYRSYREPHATITTNAIGTVNVLEALRYLNKPVIAVLITSDKVYQNVEQIWGYREDDRLGGTDPYSASKGMAELAIRSYVETAFKGNDCPIRIGIGRAGNVIGGGDWAENRIVPDCVRAWTEDKVAVVRKPTATRPWQHVLEPLAGYLKLAMMLSKDSTLHGQAFNFGPSLQHNHTVGELVDALSKYWPGARWTDDISDKSDKFKEATLLKLDSAKAYNKLEWSSILDFSQTAKFTSVWYRQHLVEPENSYNVTKAQINEYCRLAINR
jgi:CDP-glucose 4,6-dehydratase